MTWEFVLQIIVLMLAAMVFIMFTVAIVTGILAARAKRNVDMMSGLMPKDWKINE